jgi:hypothetical protein
MAVAATHAPARAAAVAASTESTALPRLQLSMAEYGLGVPSIVVYAAAEPKRLQAAARPLPSSQDQAAKSFFEDLLRRGRLKVARAGKPADGRWCCAGFASTAGADTVENALLRPI